MVDIVSSATAALQATLTGDLIKDLSQALASGSVTDAPQSIQNASSPLAISGTLTSQLANGGAVVQTAAGPVTLALNNPPVLPQGTLTLLIQPGNPPTASVIAQQAVTPQAQIQPQAAAAEQTQQTQQAQTQAALPALTVGQVLTATPLPAAPAPVIGPGIVPPVSTPPPVVAAATSNSPATSASPVQTPTAVVLSSAVAPTPPAPAVAYLAQDNAQGQSQVQSTGQQAATNQSPVTAQPTPAPLPPALTQIPSDALSELEETQELTPQANALAAQESANEDAAAPALPYSPGVTVPTPQPQASQSFVVLSVETPEQAQQSGTTGQAAATQTSSPAASPQPGQTVTATVVAQTQSGQPLLATASGALLVDQAVSTSVGTGLVLQRLSPEQAAAQPQAAPQGGAPGPSARSAPGPAPLNDVPLSIARQQPWPALTQLLGTLDRAAPDASAFIRQAIPTMGSGFVQAFTTFLSRSDQSFPMPPAMQDALKVALSPSQPGTTQELRSALVQMTADLLTTATKGAASAAVPQSWHNYQVPVLTDYGIGMAQLYVRQQLDEVDDQPGRRTGTSSTRFLVEISPSTLGPVQLDGLLRKDQTQMGRLDLIVRTEFAVSPEAGTEMEQLFQNALGATGMSGKLGFQTGPETFVLPASGADPQYRGGA